MDFIHFTVCVWSVFFTKKSEEKLQCFLVCLKQFGSKCIMSVAWKKKKNRIVLPDQPCSFSVFCQRLLSCTLWKRRNLSFIAVLFSVPASSQVAVWHHSLWKMSLATVFCVVISCKYPTKHTNGKVLTTII